MLLGVCTIGTLTLGVQPSHASHPITYRTPAVFAGTEAAAELRSVAPAFQTAFGSTEASAELASVRPAGF